MRAISFTYACLTAVAAAALVAPSALASTLFDNGFDKLPQRIVRALAIHPLERKRILIGNKGGSAGSAKVIASDDGGVSWRFLNQGRSLAPTATDVQAVAFAAENVVLAGTWKHGLFRSVDGGATFSSVTGFSPTDVRSLAVSGAERATLYAATGQNGIWKTEDAGKSWKPTALARGYFWSVESSASHPQLLLASSPAFGLFVTTDGGEKWQHVFADAEMYMAAASPLDSQIIAVAAESGLHLSVNGGQTWRQPTATKDVRLSSLAFDPSDVDRLYLGAWKKGVLAFRLSADSVVAASEPLPVTHIRTTRKATFVGTWGSGVRIVPAPSNESYLIDAVKSGNELVMSRLLQLGFSPDAFDRNRNTPLIFAARDGRKSMAQALLGAGADVDWIDGEGVTPLILAAHKNRPDVVALLLSHGADTTVRDQWNRNALDYALRRGEFDPIAVAIAVAIRAAQ